jgi:hypothetical protein
VSTTFFDQLVKEGKMPNRMAIGSRRIFDRWAIDAAFDRLPGGDQEAEVGGWDDV